MEIKNIADLIAIRNYVVEAKESFKINKKTAYQLNDMLSLIDRKIVEQILSSDFKAWVGFEDINDVVKEAIEANNIKAGMKPAQKMTVVAATPGINNGATVLKSENSK